MVSRDSRLEKFLCHLPSSLVQLANFVKDQKIQVYVVLKVRAPGIGRLPLPESILRRESPGGQYSFWQDKRSTNCSKFTHLLAQKIDLDWFLNLLNCVLSH